MQRQTKPLRYAVGMFGTSIPINMFKTYAAIYYVDQLGLSTAGNKRGHSEASAGRSA